MPANPHLNIHKCANTKAHIESKHSSSTVSCVKISRTLPTVLNRGKACTCWKTWHATKASQTSQAPQPRRGGPLGIASGGSSPRSPGVRQRGCVGRPRGCRCTVCVASCGCCSSCTALSTVQGCISSTPNVLLQLFVCSRCAKVQHR